MAMWWTLTVWEPWASLIVAGAKPYEFRGYPVRRSLIGKRIAIHAGARPVKKDEVRDLLLRLQGPEPWTTALKPEIAVPLLERVLTSPAILPRSHVLATAVLGEPTPAWRIVGEFGGAMNDSDRDAHSNWAWPVSEVRPYQPPIAASGAQGFWRWSDGGGYAEGCEQ